jgi:hypothetical protein
MLTLLLLATYDKRNTVTSLVKVITSYGRFLFQIIVSRVYSVGILSLQKG